MYEPKFLNEDGTTRPATEADAEYLKKLYPLVDAAARAEEEIPLDELDTRRE